MSAQITIDRSYRRQGSRPLHTGEHSEEPAWLRIEKNTRRVSVGTVSPGYHSDSDIYLDINPLLSVQDLDELFDCHAFWSLLSDAVDAGREEDFGDLEDLLKTFPFSELSRQEEEEYEP